MTRSARLAAVAVIAAAALVPLASPAAAEPCPSPAPASSAPPAGDGAPSGGTGQNPDPNGQPASACASPAPSSSPSTGAPGPDGGNGAAIGIGLLAVVVLGGGAGAFVWWQRRQRLAAAYGPAGYTGLAGPPSQTQAGVTPFARTAGAATQAPPRTRPPGQDETRLGHTLRDIAASGISPALTQQVERLLAKPGVRRAELVQAAIRYRDQLLERDPRLARALLEALRDVGVTETLVQDVRVNGQLHEVVGSVPAPSPQLHDTVAETTQCGYVDGDRVLRLPKVLVYRAR
ncbi:nucleotide exchange factor GrpE [Dactylosporangium sp. CA-233914]|uniref:nucleotide exchange factor GrpE n=1 Tax=Dactylosporangium sp. CA-233914 TaxID=3239934 RepID=UPI003D9394AB